MEQYGAIVSTATGDGVVSDQLFARRSRSPYALNETVAEAAKAGRCRPLLDSYVPKNSPGFEASLEEDEGDIKIVGGQKYQFCRSVLHASPMSYVEVGASRTPRIDLGGELHGINNRGVAMAGLIYRTIVLMSKPAKMNALSFSLPAGHPTMGGTCVSASATDPRRVGGKEWICDACYALKAAYTWPDVATQEATRLQFVLRCIDQDLDQGIKPVDAGKTFVDAITSGLTTIATSPEYGKSCGLERILCEIGAWNAKRSTITFPYGPLNLDVHGCDLIKEAGIPSTRDFFASRNPEDGEIVGFFRIHDSGDFSIAPEMNRTIAYIHAWKRIALAFPNVIFWAPTRLADPVKMKKITAEFVKASKEASNLIIRPSSLFTSAPAPTVKGVANGTTVAKVTWKKKSGGRIAESTVDEEGVENHLCPAYSGQSNEKDSCMTANCRACWILPERGVAYGRH